MWPSQEGVISGTISQGTDSCGTMFTSPCGSGPQLGSDSTDRKNRGPTTRPLVTRMEPKCVTTELPEVLTHRTAGVRGLDPNSWSREALGVPREHCRDHQGPWDQHLGMCQGRAAMELGDRTGLYRAAHHHAAPASPPPPTYCWARSVPATEPRASAGPDTNGPVPTVTVASCLSPSGHLCPGLMCTEAEANPLHASWRWKFPQGAQWAG